MVVPVLMTSCQVSEKPKIGPVTAQTITADSAKMKASGRPVWPAMLPAILVKRRSIGGAPHTAPSLRWNAGSPASGSRRSFPDNFRRFTNI